MDLIWVLLAMMVFGIGILLIPKESPKPKQKQYILLEVEEKKKDS